MADTSASGSGGGVLDDSIGSITRLVIPSYSERCGAREDSQPRFEAALSRVSSIGDSPTSTAAKKFRFFEGKDGSRSNTAEPKLRLPRWLGLGKVHPVVASPTTPRKHSLNNSNINKKRHPGKYRATWSTELEVTSMSWESLLKPNGPSKVGGGRNSSITMGQRPFNFRGSQSKFSSSQRLVKAGILKDPTAMSTRSAAAAKQITFDIRSTDDDKPKWYQSAPKTILQLLLTYKSEIAFACYVYEVVMVAVRLIILYNDGIRDKACWLCEASHIGLPIVDIVVDFIMTVGVVNVVYFKAMEALAWRGALQSNTSILIWGGKSYDNPLFQYLISSEFFVQWFLVVGVFWAVNSMYLPTVVFWASQALRLPRALQALSYLSKKEQDNNARISTVASVKFVLLIFLAIHWIGCGFYFLAIASGFHPAEQWQSWVPQFQTANNMYEGEWTLDAEIGGRLDPAAYLLCVYKGLNMLSHLSYENVSPRRYSELIASLVVLVLGVMVEAYILGTLFHYLVKPDPLEEAFTDFMKKVDRYCTNRHLPSVLHKRLRAYFEFQHQKRPQDDSAVADLLPHSLRVALASHLYGHLLRRNRYLLQDCNPQFTTMMLMELREVFLIPGGVIFHMGDMARELCFLVEGVIEKVKDGEVTTTMYGVTDSANILGEVAFLMSVPHPYIAQARKTSAATLLTLSRTSFDRLLAPYPEAYEQMMTNLLEEYDMDRKGVVQNAGRVRGLDDNVLAERMEMTAIIQGALAQRNADSMGSLKYAVSEADMDSVRRLLNEGFDITSTDYDGRTILHLAAIAGEVKIVEMLVHDFHAPVAVPDRWGRLPLDDALAHDHSLVVNFLRENMGSGLGGSRYTRGLCYAAASGDAELVMRNMHNGMDCNTSLYDGRTPLHIAASRGHLKVTEFLLSKGAAINAEDVWGCTPLEDAVLNGHELMSHLLRFSGGKLGKKIRTNRGHAAMHLMTAVSEGNIAKMKLMVENGISPDVCDYDLRTSIHIAASDGMLLSVSFLVEKCNCEINPIDRWKKTPMQDALDAEHMSVAVLLRAYGGELGPSADPSLMDKFNAMANVPDIKLVRQQVTAMIESQTAKGMALQDMSNADQNQQSRQVAMMLIPRVGEVSAEVLELQEDIRVIERAMGPVLLMLTVALTQPGAAAAETIDIAGSLQGTGPNGDAEGRSGGGGGANIHRSSSISGAGSSGAKNFNRSSSLSGIGLKPGGGTKNEGQGRLVRLLLTFGDLGVHIKRLARAFYQGGEEMPDQINALLTSIGVQYEAEVVTILRDAVVDMAEAGEFENLDFYKLVCTEQMSNLVHSGEGPFATPEQLMCLRQITSAIDALSLAWGWLSPDGEMHVSLDDLSPQVTAKLGTSGLQSMRDTLSDMGSKDMALKKHTLLHLLMVMVGEADIDDSDGEEVDDTASMSDSQSEGTGIGSITDDLITAAGQMKGFPQLSMTKGDPHQALMDEINMLTGQAMSAIAAYDDYIQQLGWQGSLATFLKHAVLREPRVEEMFANEIFNLMDEDGTEILDDDELDILRKALLEKIQRSVKVEPGEEARNERIQEVERVTLDIYNKIDTASSVQMGRAEFIKFCKPLLTVWRDVDNKHKAEIAMGNLAHVSSAESSKFVISHHSKWLARWKWLNMGVDVFFFLDVPFRIAFHSLYCFGGWYLVLGILCEFQQIANIILQFHTAYVNKNSVVVTQLGKVRRHYLSHGFLRDFIGSIPFDFFMFAGNDFSLNPRQPGAFYWLQPKVQSWLRLPRLLLIVGVFRWWQRHLATANNSHLRTAIKRFFPYLLALVHLLSCAWWMVGTWSQWIAADNKEYQQRAQPIGTSWTFSYIGLGYSNDIITAVDDCLSQYLLSLYWVTTTLATNGQVTGMQPANWREVAFACLCMLISLTVYSYVLGELSFAVMKKDEALVHERAQLLLVQGFVNGRELPPSLREAILSQFESMVATRGAQASLQDDSEEVVGKLPHSLQVEVARCVSRALVGKVEIMENCKDSFLDALSVLLKEKTMTRDGFLFRANEICDSLYIVWKGAIEFVVEEEGEIFVTRTLEPGSVIGELGFFFGMKQSESARSKLNSQGAALFVLHHKDFKELVRLYPQEEQVIVKQVLTMHKDRTALVQEHEFLDSDGHLLEVQRSMEGAEKRKRQQHIVDAVTAAAAGEIHKLKGLLREHGLMVDEADYHGRTALHLAAANGHLNVVTWLVGTMRADANITDNNGVSPLMEAVNFKEHEVAKYLRSKRATLMADEKAGEVCKMASEGQLEDIKLLAENGFELSNVKDYDQRSPLHLAASRGYVDLVKYLVQQGIDVNVRDRNNYTPLQDAMLNGHTEVVSVLRSSGGSIFSGEMAYRLCMMAYDDDLDGMKALVEVGVDPNLPDYDMRTALHLASCCESVMVATYLLSRTGAGNATAPGDDSEQNNQVDLNPLDRYGCTPLDDAVRHESGVMQSMLHRHGAKIGADDMLVGMHAAAKADAEKAAVEQAAALAAQMLKQTSEMTLLEVAGTMRKLLSHINDSLHDQCRVFFNSARDLVKVGLRNKAWGARQLVRLRRLNDSARALAAYKKMLDREVELILRRTNDLNLTFLSGSRRGLKAQILHLQMQFRCAVALVERFLEEGRRTQFTFPPMRNKRNRVLLHGDKAEVAYNALRAHGVDLTYEPAERPRVVHIWRQLQRQLFKDVNPDERGDLMSSHRTDEEAASRYHDSKTAMYFLHNLPE